MNTPKGRCIDCRHFQNHPRFLEETYHGLASFSSGHASVRKDDGICQERGLYLSANAWCDAFAADTPETAPTPASAPGLSSGASGD